MTRLMIPAAAALAALALAGEASAHARLIHSDPKNGTTVAAPKVLRLQFSEEIVGVKSSVKLTGPGGAAPIGQLSVDAQNPRLVTVPVTGALKPGAYKIHWVMTSQDTHTMSGDIAFKVK